MLALIFGAVTSAMILGSHLIQPRLRFGWPWVFAEAFGLVPSSIIIPHYDAGATRVGGLLARSLPPGLTLIGVDEQTALVSDDRIRALNRTYRGTDSATDVLSFSYDDQSFLGDIVIARGVAKRQAREAGHSEATEIRVLALHGLLHLLGYDHERDAGRMRRVEERLRRKGGLRGGLIERARPSTGSGRARKKSARDKRVQTNARGELVEPRAIPR